jgi:pimeloyl-ACP methyl ester carboxylesterase
MIIASSTSTIIDERGQTLKNVFKRLAQLLGGLVILVILVIAFLTIQANLRENQTRFEAAPAAGRFVPAGDVELYIQELGPQDGPAILFIHGTASWSGLWHDTMTPLAQAGYHCIAIDIPPFGFSERPPEPSYGNAAQAARIVALMDSLEIEYATLYGHSFGGGATLETALMIPERIDALVLLDVGGMNIGLPPTDQEDVSALKLFFDTRLVRDPILAATATNPLLTKPMISTMLLDPADATDEAIEILQQPLVIEGSTSQLGDWLGYVLNTVEVSRTSDPANYQTLTMPALIIWGDSDTVIPLEEGEYLQSLLPDAELVVMEGVNHIPHLEDLERLTPIVLDFLDENIE